MRTAAAGPRPAPTPAPTPTPTTAALSATTKLQYNGRLGTALCPRLIRLANF
jgi:hypothetical protein